MPCTLTPEQRKAGQLKSIEMRKLYAAQRKAALNAPPPEPTAEQTLAHQRRLVRVCKQLDLVDSRIEEELAKTGSPNPVTGEPECCDGQLVNWLCSAQERLAEQERILSGRPLPGSLKPSSRQPRRSPSPSSPDLPQG